MGSNAADVSERRPRSSALSSLVLVATLALGAVLSLFIASDVAQVDATCHRKTPWFEGLVVADSDQAWPPPLVRCTFTDTDAPQLGERSTRVAWGWYELVGVGAVCATAAIWLGRRVRRRRVQKFDNSREPGWFVDRVPVGLRAAWVVLVILNGLGILLWSLL